MRQWILDKRKPNQRYTFWIAVIALFLALVFGLIQSVTGIIQVMHIN
jgi:Ni/Fe-hydrogenase subunit HybB-like protein